MKVVVTGSSKVFKADLARSALEALHRETPISTVLVDSSNGYPYLASVWALDRGIPIRVFSAKKYGGAFKNNSEMLSRGPDLVVAFPGEGVTHDLVSKANDKGIKVVEIHG